MNKTVQNGTLPDQFLCETCAHAHHRKGSGGEHQVICSAAERERFVTFRVVECNSYFNSEDNKQTRLQKMMSLYWPKAWQIVPTEEGPLRMIPPNTAAAHGLCNPRSSGVILTERQVKLAKLEVFAEGEQ